MNVEQLKRTGNRFESVDVSSLKIQAYGADNLYPQRISRLIACSDTGVNCLTRYIDFIRGNGFKNEVFAAMQVNSFGDTFDDIHDLLSDDLANYNGFAIHFNYDLTGKTRSIQHIPFENCRLGLADEFGIVHKIAIFPDWEGKKMYGGKAIKPTPDNIDYIDTFNPKPSMVIAQIEAAGGIEFYKGQILWVSSAGRYTYPKAKYDSAVTYLSTEDGLGNISNRNVKNGFFPSGMLVIKRGQDAPANVDSKGIAVESPRYKAFETSFSDQVAMLQGDMDCQKILCVEVEHEEDIPQFIPIKGENYDKDFTVTSTNATERIYAAFQQEVFYRLRIGAVGFSADMITDAFDYYNSSTNSMRRMLERAYDKIVKSWHTELSVNDTVIEPLTYKSSKTTDNANGILNKS